MSNFVPNKPFLRGILLHYFIQKKSAAEAHRILVEIYGEHALSERTCRDWFNRFKNCDFNLQDRERSGASKKFEDEELETLLDEDPCQTQSDIAQLLGVDRTTVLGMIHKEGSWVPNPGLYKIILLSRLTYAAIVWWPRVKKMEMRNLLESLQRGYLKAATGAAREDWQDPNFLINPNVNVWYTDGLRANDRFETAPTPIIICICSDSRVAINTLAKTSIEPSVGHQGMLSNERADRLAKLGTEMDLAKQTVGVPFVLDKRKIKEMLEREHFNIELIE
ncbi:MOS1T transposase, partial [Pseudoatta argentina]